LNTRAKATTKPDWAIEVRNLSFAYDGKHRVLRDADFAIEHGQVIAIIGPNGGGKTTLLKLLLGLLEPSQGSLRVLGKTPVQARKHVGYVPQHVQFDPHFPVTAWDIVLMGRLGYAPLIGPFRRKDRKAATTALDRVGLSDMRNAKFSEMSGGQRQRVLIARALVCEPKLMLLDEPTSNLDVGMEKLFYDLLDQLKGDMTVGIVSHDIGFVAGQIEQAVCVNGNVAVHPTEALSGQVFEDMYGGEISMIQHQHNLPTGHSHDPSQHGGHSHD